MNPALHGLAPPRAVVDAAAKQRLDSRRHSRRQSMPGAAMQIGARISSPPASIEAMAVRPVLATNDAATDQQLGAEALRLPAGEPASSAPPMPSGNPKKFSIIDVCDAWPPGRSRSRTTVDRPSDAA